MSINLSVLPVIPTNFCMYAYVGVSLCVGMRVFLYRYVAMHSCYMVSLCPTVCLSVCMLVGLPGGSLQSASMYVCPSLCLCVCLYAVASRRSRGPIDNILFGALPWPVGSKT